MSMPSGAYQALRRLGRFATAYLLAVDLREIGKIEPALRSLVAGISIQADCMEIILKPGALSIEAEVEWSWILPLPARRPFREARIRIDNDANEASASGDLLALMADAMAAQRLALVSP